MKKSVMRTAKGVMAGVAVGTMVSVVSIAAMKPKPAKTFRKKAVKALDTVGGVMMDLADWTK